jgi:hypothetical protein
MGGKIGTTSCEVNFILLGKRGAGVGILLSSITKLLAGKISLPRQANPRTKGARVGTVQTPPIFFT